jgi:hypothetical protein
MTQLSIAAVSSVIVCKQKIQQPMLGGGMAYISQPDPRYLWAARLLLERVSWYVRDNRQQCSAIVTFAHITRFKTAKLHAYRVALENATPPTEIHWPSSDGHPFRL